MRAHRPFALLFLLIGLCTGCTKPAAEFVFREETQQLIPEAREEVETAVEDAFGTPDDLAAWLKMPVEFGAIEATLVSDGPVKDSATSLKFQISAEDAAQIEQAGKDIVGCGLLWNSGAAGGSGATIAEVELQDAGADEEGSILRVQLTASVGEKTPAGGDTCTVVGYRIRSGRRLYQRHCQHCHGTSGDGDGPTAKYLNPRPRDYRNGVFKFTNIKDQVGAAADDLHRLIKQGIPGTYMPSFMLLPDNEVADIAQYVRFLAMRGQYERSLDNELGGDFSEEAWAEMESEDRTALLDEFFRVDKIFNETKTNAGDLVAEAWVNAETEEAVIVPPVARIPDSAESRALGRQLFLDDKTKCVACHGVNGLGNGPQTTSKQKDAAGNERSTPGLYDLWNEPVRPRNLTRGIYRGGRRPYDLYCRIAYGIKGTPMAGFASSLKPEEIWHLVNYVLSVPHESNIPGRTTLTKEVASADEHGEDEDKPAKHDAEASNGDDSGE